MILLSPWDLVLAALLIGLQALLAFIFRLGMVRAILVAALRTAIQLSLIGLVLKFLFQSNDPLLVLALSAMMIMIGGREVTARQKYRFRGSWGLGIGSISLFVSSFSVSFVALVVILQPTPWYAPQYAIPLLGMILGNMMNGVALSLDRLTELAWQQRAAIEAQLALGRSSQQALQHLRQESMRTGMIPIINAMAAAGLVSLPGMMTGQILAGTSPVEAVKYQILIMYLIAGSVGLGTMMAVYLGGRRLFDHRERLRLDRLQRH